MGALGNTPRRTTVASLEAAKSFAFELEFVHDTGLAYDLTGATVRLVVAQPAHKGGAVVLTETAVPGDLVEGVVQFELQAADLDLVPGEYPFDITLVTADGYSVPVDKGVFDIRSNVDTTATNVYAGVDLVQGLKVTLGNGNRVFVQLTSLPGPQGPPGADGTDGADGAPGTPGHTAYQLALLNGFVGTEAEWLASLVGPEGPEGPQGPPGQDGVDGVDGAPGAPGDGSVNSVNGDAGPDVVLDAADVGAAPAGHTHTAAEVGASPTGHSHDDLYYTEAEVNTLLSAKAALTRTINDQTDSYTLVLADAGKWVRLNKATAVTLTVPTNATVAFPIGTVIEGSQAGAGQVTIAGAGGVTVNATPGLKVAAQYGTFGLLKTGTDTWLAYGRLSA